MFLTRVLSFYKRRRHVPGRLDTGKNKIVPKVTVAMKREALEQMLLEKHNLSLLDNPYLSKIEEHGYMNALGIPQAERIAKIEEQRAKMNEHVRAEDILGHLNVKKAWE